MSECRCRHSDPLLCAPCTFFQVAFDRNDLTPGDVSSYLTGAAIGAAVAGTGAAIAAVAATARSAADGHSSGVKQGHGSRWVLLLLLLLAIMLKLPHTCLRGHAFKKRTAEFFHETQGRRHEAKP